MTRKNGVRAAICGSHICMVVPSEFDSIRVGPPSRPSTETLSRQPSASIIGIFFFLLAMCGRDPRTIPKTKLLGDGLPGQARQRHRGLVVFKRGEQAVDQGLRNAL